jgi:hypothetical protein
MTLVLNITQLHYYKRFDIVSLQTLWKMYLTLLPDEKT